MRDKIHAQRTARGTFSSAGGTARFQNAKIEDLSYRNPAPNASAAGTPSSNYSRVELSPA